MNSTVLIDDQGSNFGNGQKKNGLIIEYADALLFDYTLFEDTCMDAGVRSVNHIFYVTGLLERLFSSSSRPITQSLFELQYNENGQPRFELCEDNSLYVNGLKTLQQYASQSLEFYGYDANKLFSFAATKDRGDLTNVSGYSPFWSVSNKSNQPKETDGLISPSILSGLF